MRISGSQKIMLAVMVIALELVFIYASGMFGLPGYVILLISSAAAYTLTCEGLYGIAFFTYITAGVAGILISPDKISAIAFLAFFGHYPLFKTYVDSNTKNKIAAMCIKLLYCNAWVIAALLIVIFAMKIPLPTDLPIPMGVCVLIAEAGFFIFDLLHSAAKWLYTEKIRSGILPKY